jgi:hypothetical protein
VSGGNDLNGYEHAESATISIVKLPTKRRIIMNRSKSILAFARPLVQAGRVVSPLIAEDLNHAYTRHLDYADRIRATIPP